MAARARPDLVRGDHGSPFCFEACVHTISREELYQQIWSRPMTKVAAEYGVTSTALKKTCNRHKIPTPGRGYWAKCEHNKPVHQVSLPKLSAQQNE
jgi:hypothetical protein